jgi:tryptophan-rich sensory protein
VNYNKKINWLLLVICIGLPLAVGGLSALLTRNSMEDFAILNQPPLAPPGWLFPIVWTILFVLMGIASYLVLQAENPYGKSLALGFYLAQLFFNFCWSIIFFNLKAYLAALLWLVVLWFLILITAFLFYQKSKAAGLLLTPYLLWVFFAGYLNLGIYLLN